MKKIILLLMVVMQLSGCATYENRSISFKPPQNYSNYQDITGVKLGAEAFAQRKDAEEVFGFDILGAGVLPVQIVMDNSSEQGVEVVAGQTFLIDASNRYWKILTNNEAINRIESATHAGVIASGAGKGAGYGAAAGALLGLAIGIVSGHSVPESIVKGGIIGGAGGAIIGSSDASEDQRVEYNIATDVRQKGIEGKIIPIDSLASGFIYFPAEAQTAQELRLQIKFRSTGRIQTLNLGLK